MSLPLEAERSRFFFHGSLEGGNAREIFCWPSEPHGRRLAAPSTAASGGSPPRDVKIIFCLYGNPHGGGLRHGPSPRSTWTFHVSPRCGTQVYLIPRGGGGPPPEMYAFEFFCLPWGLDLGGPWSLFSSALDCGGLTWAQVTTQSFRTFMSKFRPPTRPLSGSAEFP